MNSSKKQLLSETKRNTARQTDLKHDLTAIVAMEAHIHGLIEDKPKKVPQQALLSQRASVDRLAKNTKPKNRVNSIELINQQLVDMDRPDD